LVGLEHFQEALDEHFLPFGKPFLDRVVDATISSDEAHGCKIAHLVVGRAEMKLNQPAKALPHFEQAQSWAKLLIDREPNEARYARDWSEIHSIIGATLIALGRFDEGVTNLQTGVRLAEAIVARDPMNGSSQELMMFSLRQLAEGLGKVASAPGTGPARRSELLQQVVQLLTRCEAMLSAPEFERIRPHLSAEAMEIAQLLNEAHKALEKITGDDAAEASKP
jgi:tetratricopeptide (TPR) repeat protein